MSYNLDESCPTCGKPKTDNIDLSFQVGAYVATASNKDLSKLLGKVVLGLMDGSAPESPWTLTRTAIFLVEECARRRITLEERKA